MSSSPPVRAQAHARAAKLLAGEGAEPERIAVQLLACEPAGNPDVVQGLRTPRQRRWAARTRDRVAYLRRALAESPSESHRAAGLAELGGAETLARDRAAVVHLELALVG